MYSFTINQNKESITVLAEPAADQFKITVTLTGKEHSRLISPGPAGPEGCIVSYVTDGPITFYTKAKAELQWGVSGAMYDNRRITLNLAGDKPSFVYEPWGNAPAPKYHDYYKLFEHNLATNPTPVYKMYTYKGELKYKLEKK